MKYRIKKQTFSDGTINFKVQRKILFVWLLAWEEYPEYSRGCNYGTFQKAQNFINSQNKTKVRIIKTEIVST